MKPILALAGKKLGFKMDAKNYKDVIIKDCVIEAILNGFEVTGNQFNIIGGNMYGTKEGYTALLEKINAEYDITYGILFLIKINKVL